MQSKGLGAKQNFKKMFRRQTVHLTCLVPTLPLPSTPTMKDDEHR